jgi:hypothetical protein
MANAPTVVPAILLTPDTVGFLSGFRIRADKRALKNEKLAGCACRWQTPTVRVPTNNVFEAFAVRF